MELKVAIQKVEDVLGALADGTATTEDVAKAAGAIEELKKADARPTDPTVTAADALGHALADVHALISKAGPQPAGVRSALAKAQLSYMRATNPAAAARYELSRMSPQEQAAYNRGNTA